MPVDINITRPTKGINKTVRATNGRFISAKQASKPRFKTAWNGEGIYDRKSKRVAAYTFSKQKANELVSILNRKV